MPTKDGVRQELRADAPRCGFYVGPALASRSFVASIVRRLQADHLLSPIDILGLTLGVTHLALAGPNQPRHRPTSVRDVEGLIRRDLGLLRKRTPMLLVSTIRALGIRDDAHFVKVLNDWARRVCSPDASGVEQTPWAKHIAEWRARLQQEFLLPRLPHVRIPGGGLALDARPMLKALRRAAVRKGVTLPQSDADLLDDLKEVALAPHNSTTRAGNLAWRMGEDDRSHINENLWVDRLRTHYRRCMRVRSGVHERASRESEGSDRADAEDTLDALAATGPGAKCMARSRATFAALLAHSGAHSFRMAARRLGVTPSAVQRAIRWVRQEFPALRGVAAAPE